MPDELVGEGVNSCILVDIHRYMVREVVLFFLNLIHNKNDGSLESSESYEWTAQTRVYSMMENGSSNIFSGKGTRKPIA